MQTREAGPKQRREQSARSQKRARPQAPRAAHAAQRSKHQTTTHHANAPAHRQRATRRTNQPKERAPARGAPAHQGAQPAPVPPPRAGTRQPPPPPPPAKRERAEPGRRTHRPADAPVTPTVPRQPKSKTRHPTTAARREPARGPHAKHKSTHSNNEV